MPEVNVQEERKPYPDYVRDQLHQPASQWGKDRLVWDERLKKIHPCYNVIWNPILERWEVWVKDVDGKDTYHFKLRVMGRGGAYRELDERLAVDIAMFDREKGLNTEELLAMLDKAELEYQRDLERRGEKERAEDVEKMRSLLSDQPAMSRVGQIIVPVTGNLA